MKDKVEQVISEDFEKSVSGKLSVRSYDMIETNNRRAVRRESTISADQVSKAQELAQINKQVSGSPPMSQNNPAPKIVQPPKDALRRKSVNVGKVPSPLPQNLQ